MIFGRRRPELPVEPDWDDPMWVPQPVERWIEPEEVAERLRRRRARWRALRHAVVMLLVVLVVGGTGVIAGGAVLGRWELPWAPTPRAAPEASPSPGAVAPPDCERAVVTPAAAQGTSVRVLNATTRTGLAGEVQDELETRGFVVTEIGNSRLDVPEAALVTFPPGAEPAALVVAAQLSGAVLRQDPTAPVVTVLLGDAWTATTTVEVAAQLGTTPQPSVIDCAVPPAEVAPTAVPAP